jgi:hypothetical protein
MGVERPRSLFFCEFRELLQFMSDFLDPSYYRLPGAKKHDNLKNAPIALASERRLRRIVTVADDESSGPQFD